MLDPSDIRTKSEYDALGRTTATIENYIDGTPSDDTDRTTRYTYDGMGNVLTMTADMPSGTNDQTTAYVYGATTASGSDINSNSILTAIQYPDPSTGLPQFPAGDVHGQCPGPDHQQDRPQRQCPRVQL